MSRVLLALTTLCLNAALADAQVFRRAAACPTCPNGACPQPSGPMFLPVPAIPPAPLPNAAVVPAGYHAHRRLDGTVFVHGDENYGSAAAHAGVTLPWPKVALAGQVCPTGACPAATLSLPPASASFAVAVYTESPRPVRRFVTSRPLRRLLFGCR